MTAVPSAASADDGDPNPHFNVEADRDSVWGHDWPQGATLTVEVDGTVVADDVEVYTDWDEHGGPGDFALHDSGFDFQAGQHVTVSSDDPPVSKSHTVTDLTITDIDEGTDTVSGTTDSEAGSIVEVHLHSPDGWRMRNAEVEADGTWSADFSQPVGGGGEGWNDPADIGPGIDGSAWERDDDGDSTVAHWGVANPHFNVNSWNDSMWGHEWTPGATLIIEADGTVVADDVEVNEWGDFDTWDLEHDFQAGQTVTVTSDDDPPHVKTHVITALEVTEVDPEADTVAGTTDSDPGGTVEVHLYVHDTWRMRHVEVAGDGSWLADFSESVEDHGDGWGQPFDIVPGIHGNAHERDEDGDGTFADWYVPNPHFNVDPDHNWIWGHEWPADTELDITITGGDPDPYEASTTTQEWGDFDIGLDREEFVLQAGQVVEVTDGTTTRTHTVTALTVVEVNLYDAEEEANTVKGTTDSPEGSTVEVVMHLDDGERIREPEVDADGNWVADFNEPVDDHGHGWGDPGEIRVGVRGSAVERDEQYNGTFIGWGAQVPHFNIKPDSGHLWGHEWNPGATITITVNGDPVTTDPEVVTVVEESSDWYQAGDIDLTITDPAIETGDEIIVSDGTETATHVVTALTVTDVDAATDIVTGTAEPGSEGFVVVDHWESGRNFVADETTGEWTADFSQPIEAGPHQPGHWEHPYDIVPGTGVEAWQHDDRLNATVIVSMASFAFDDALATQPEVTATIDVLANDAMPEGDDTLEVISVDAASAEGGDVVCTAGGECTYTPPAGFVGDDAFTYEVQALPSERVDTATVYVSVRPDDASFTDVPTDHTFFTEIEWLALNEITTGYADGTFRPTAEVTRQATAAFFYRYAGEPEFTPPATPTFTDVPTDHPFFEEIEWLVSTGITTGYADGTFRPTAVVTRQATAAFFFRYAGEPVFTPPTTPSFTDVPTDHPFFEEIEWLADTKVTTGYADGTFRPTATVTRQATAAFFYRYDRLP